MDLKQLSTRSKILNNIPNSKLDDILQNINVESEDIETVRIQMTKKNAIRRYYESNIPIEYWKLKMTKDFVGSKVLLELFSNYTSNLKESFSTGNSFCLAGTHGIGKTMVLSCILKKAAESGYCCLYSTLSDIVSVLTTAPSEDKFFARRELMMVDYLVIDEFDPRFIGSDNAADLYARTLESIFRTRAQNKLPTLMSTNSPNVINAFSGALKDSLDSLFSGYIKLYPIIDNDFRKNKKQP